MKNYNLHSPHVHEQSVLKTPDSLTPGRYNPCRVLADSRSRLQPSLSLALILQFLTPSLSASLITPSIHLRFGLPRRFLSSGLSKVIFLHGRLSCISTICPAHPSLVILIVVLLALGLCNDRTFQVPILKHRQVHFCFTLPRLIFEFL